MVIIEDSRIVIIIPSNAPADELVAIQQALIGVLQNVEPEKFNPNDSSMYFYMKLLNNLLANSTQLEKGMATANKF